jgi:hypothetical protein
MAAGLCLAQSAPAGKSQPSTAAKPTAKSKTSKTPSKSTHSTASKSTAKKTTGKSASKSSSRKSKSRKAAKGWRSRGQQAIDPQRAREIQEALIREHYLNGEPSGTWDAASQKAMEKFQADNGWQSKSIPDSRALIKLGLGPSHDHLLNPETAMGVNAPVSTPVAPTSTAAPVSIPATTPPQDHPQ